MIRTLYFLIGFWLHQILIIPLLLLALLLRRIGYAKASLRIARRVGRDWGKLLLFLAGVKVTIHGQIDWPKDKAVLLVGNHQGAFDIPIWLVSAGRDVAFIAKKELRSIPLVGKWMDLIGCVFIDRDDRRQSVRAIREAIQKLQEGITLVVFPEGTRSDRLEMAPFKKGSLSIGGKAGVPVLPITVKGSYLVQEKGKPGLNPTSVDVYLDAPIQTEELSAEDVARLHEIVQGQIAGHLGLPGLGVVESTSS